MRTITLTINGSTSNVNVDEAKLTKEQQAELKAVGVEAEHAIKFSGGSVRFLNSDALTKMESQTQTCTDVADSLNFS